MKRQMTGGAHRGPVGPGRQRRTIRFVQVLLVLISGGLMMFAGYSLGVVNGYQQGERAQTDAAGDSFDRPRPPSVAQPIVLVILGGVAIAVAGALQEGGGVKLPTPARVDEFAGRAEREAIDRAERSSEDRAEKNP